MALEIGTASAAELVMLSDWAAEEGWNPGRSDTLAFAAADPAGFLVGRLDGEAIASISAVRYGSEYGFIGFYLVRPDHRGKGYGMQLWRAGMERLAGRNVGLDGVVDQQENYRKSGFRHAYNTIRYEGVPAVTQADGLAAAGQADGVAAAGQADGVAAVGQAAGLTVVDGRSVPFDQLAAYDRRFFPADRATFLATWIGLPERRSIAAMRDGQLQGFAVLRNARSATRIGPIFADSDEVAEALVAGVSTLGTHVAIDVPDANQAGTKLAERLGLEPTFECARMYTGPDPDLDLNGIFGTASLELG